MARFNLEDYVEVKDRVKAFNEDNPMGSIHAELVAFTPNLESVIVKASIWKVKDSGEPDAIDLAQEHKGSHAMVNTTSWVENCATSAIGRALHNLGYGLTDAKPSREEMTKVARGGDQLDNVPRDPAPSGYRPDPNLYQTQRTLSSEPRPQVSASNAGKPASDKQINLIKGLSRQIGYSEDEYETMVANLSMGAASETIEGLRRQLATMSKE